MCKLLSKTYFKFCTFFYEFSTKSEKTSSKNKSSFLKLVIYIWIKLFFWKSCVLCKRYTLLISFSNSCTSGVSITKATYLSNCI